MARSPKQPPASLPGLVRKGQPPAPVAPGVQQRGEVPHAPPPPAPVPNDGSSSPPQRRDVTDINLTGVGADFARTFNVFGATHGLTKIEMLYLAFTALNMVGLDGVKVEMERRGGRLGRPPTPPKFD